MTDRKQVLAKLDLFAGLSDRELDEVAAITRRKSLHKQDLLFRKGDEGGDIYVIVRGRLKAFATGPDGDEIVFRYMEPGEITGDLAAFTEGRRSASNVALEDCELLMIQRRELMPLLRRTPDIAIRIIAALAARTIQISQQLEDKNFRTVNQRLAKTLLAHADRWGRAAAGGGMEIGIAISQSEFGEFAGATRESVNKAFKDWREAGVIGKQGQSVVIKDRAALEKIAREE